MPNHQQHCAISKQRTGFDFAELHQWIDQHPAANSLGPDHRVLRHAFTIDDRNKIKSYWDQKKGTGWGEKAVIEWLFHIAIDNISTAFKLSKSHYGENTYNLIKIEIESSGSLKLNFERTSDNEIIQEFN